ncbi:hypothetical protein KDA23_07760, partial [Candidatus Saccharibacteria bacterium]|nr:hypothetical protein [Candidatus Saccharibacteria bacterium]
MSNRLFNNMTECVLSSDEEFVLSLGHKFILPPIITPQRLESDLRIFKRRFQLRVQFGPDPAPKYSVPNPDFKPKALPPPLDALVEKGISTICDRFNTHPDLNNGRHLWRKRITNGLRLLKTRNDIIIKPADKNLGLTVVSREWYLDQIEAHLLDLITYSPVAAENIDGAITDYRDLIDQLWSPTDRGWEKLRRFLLDNCDDSITPYFYLLPKIHKSPPSSRPICASHSFFSTPLATWVNDQLLPLTQQFTPTVCHSSQQLVNAIATITLDSTSDWILATGDVTSLYPNIPTEHALDLIKPFLYQHLNQLSAHRTFSALDFLLYNHFTQFDDKLYHQDEGTAMGVQFAPAYANIFMYLLERDTVDSVRPLFYIRYIDDIFIIARRAEFEILKTQLDSQHAN